MCSNFCWNFLFDKSELLLRLSFVFAVVNSGLIEYGPFFGIGADIEPLSECPYVYEFEIPI